MVGALPAMPSCCVQAHCCRDGGTGEPCGGKRNAEPGRFGIIWWWHQQLDAVRHARSFRHRSLRSDLRHQAATQERERGLEAAKESARASHRSADVAEQSLALNAETAKTSGVRSDAEALAKRYQDAAAQLGHDTAAVRLAGAYALARLADDWVEQRQTCVDVLCAYLRMPASSVVGDGNGPLEAAEGQVRSTIQRLIAAHLVGDAAVSWSECEFDFAGAELRDFNLEGAVFKQEPDFSRVTFTGHFQAFKATFAKGVNFTEARWESHFRMHDITVLAGTLHFYRATVAGGGLLATLCLAKGARIDLSWMSITGRNMVVTFRPTSEPQGTVFLNRPLVANGGTLTVDPDRIGGDDPDKKERPTLVEGSVVDVAPTAAVHLPQNFRPLDASQVVQSQEGHTYWVNDGFVPNVINKGPAI